MTWTMAGLITIDPTPQIALEWIVSGVLGESRFRFLEELGVPLGAAGPAPESHWHCVGGSV